MRRPARGRLAPAAFDALVVAAFMATSVASGYFGAAGYDTTRDAAQAYAIRQLAAFPLHGPLFAGSFHLGPLWFYVLALPLFVHSSWTALSLFVAALGALQFPLAYATGRRLLDRRLGLLWCALLALPGWGSFQLVGFAHTNVVPTTVLLVLYALARLAQEREPRWLVAAGGALSLAIHAHPSAVALAPLVAIVALHALRDVAALLRWGAAALGVALLPFAPLAFELLTAGPAATTSAVGPEGTAHLANLAHLPALLWGVAVRGPRVVADAFLAWSPGTATAAWLGTLAIECIAMAGLVPAWIGRRALLLTVAAVAFVMAAAIAWIRPATPFYMVYALLPPLAAAGALGTHALAARTSARLVPAVVAAALALHVAVVAGIARAIVGGDVSVPVVSRLDVKQDDPTAATPEPWLPAYAVDASGSLLCAQPQPIVLHGTYAYLEDVYLGLDHRLRCGARDVRLLGAAPAEAVHLLGIAQPLWMALGWSAPARLGGLVVVPTARVLWPAEGFAVPDGSRYPPHDLLAGAAQRHVLEATLPPGEALVVSLPYALWMPAPALRVLADGRALAPLARDAVSAVYACRDCAAGTALRWRVEIEAVAPERVDVVTLAPPG